MKKLLFLFVLMVSVLVTSGQLKGKTDCPEITVDILTGRVNGIKPDVPFVEIKKLLSCYQFAAIEESDSAKCGGGIFFKDKDLYFYTRRDYIEVGEKFKGKLTVPLLGATRASMFGRFGNPKVKDRNWDAFQTQYGTLVIYYNAANKANKIQFSTLDTNLLSLCE